MNIKDRLLYKEIQMLFEIAPITLIIWTITEAVISFFGPVKSRVSKLLFDIIEKNISLNYDSSVIYSVILVITFLFTINFAFMLGLKINDLCFSYINTKVSAGLHKQVIKKLSVTPYIKYEESQFYNQLHSVQNEISGGNLIQVYVSIVGSFIRFAAIAVMFAMLTNFSVFAAAISVVCCIPGFMHQKKYGEESWKFASSTIPQIRKMTHFFKLIITPEAFKEIKLYDLPYVFKNKHDCLYKDYYGKLKSFHSKNCGKGVVLALIHSVGTVSVIGWIYFSAAKGEISLGDAVMYTSLSTLIYNGIQHIVYTASRFTESFKLAGNIVNFLSDKRESEATKELNEERCENFDDCKYTILDEISFEDVEFSYPGSKKKVLDGISFKVKQGQKVAFAGENGSGKSTLAKLLLGLYPADKGEILIKGRNINELSASEIADTFSTCFQDFYTYSYSIRENIGFGNLFKLNDDEYLLDAVGKSGLSSSVKLTDSIDLECLINRDFSENGLVLSGGQSQKLAIARAFSSAGDIVILDEPSASLDILSEHEIFERTLSLMKDKTVFIITHRLANIISADIILYIRDGKIYEMGTHKELMKLKGEYARLFELQAERYGVMK